MVEVYKKLGQGENQFDYRKVRFVNETYGKLIGHHGVDVRQIIPQLKDIFNKSVPVFSEPVIQKTGHKPHSNLKGYHHYLGKINIAGEQYYVRFTVQELKTKPQTLKRGFVPNEVHSALKSDVEIYKNSVVAPVPSGLLTQPRQPQHGISDTKLLQFFKDAGETKENTSKVVGENREPLPVWHTTNEDFTKFETSKSRQNADIPAFFFATNKEDWKDMGSKAMPVFLNLRNPVEKPDANM